jgi:hypothetical protein
VKLIGLDVKPRRIHEPVLNVNGNNAPQDDSGAADLRRVSADAAFALAGRGGFTTCDGAVVNPALVEMCG